MENLAELLASMGTDPERWSVEFCAEARRRGIQLDQEWVSSWFDMFAESMKADA